MRQESRKFLTTKGTLETVVSTSMATDRTRPRSVAVFVSRSESPGSVTA